MNITLFANLFVLTRVQACDINKHAESWVDFCAQHGMLRPGSVSPQGVPAL